MSEGNTFMRTGEKYVDFGDFTLKLIAEVHGASEGYWLCTCETEVHKFLETRQILLPTSSFDTKGKFLSSLRGQFTSGSFSLSGAVSQRDIAEFYQFLKADYHLGTPRMCQFIKHVGHQRNNEWFINEEVQIRNGNLVPQDKRKFLCIMGDEFKEFYMEISCNLLMSDRQLPSVLNRFIELADKAFGDNKNSMLAATAFVGWRLMANALEGNNGEANIGLIYSSARSVGKTSALEMLAYGQGCSKKSHPLLISLGDQCMSGTSLKMVMEKLSKTTMVACLDDGKMTENLAEFLLQLQGGLSQGSTSAGSFIPRGSVLLTSNFDVPERLTGRVIKFPFKTVGGYSKEVELALSGMSKLITENRGVFSLWAMRTIPLFKQINKEVVPEVADILAKCFPEYQARWHKGVAGVITSHAMLLRSARVKEPLGQIINQHLDLQEMENIRSTLQKVQLSIFYQIKRDSVPSKVLSWLNPSVQVNVGQKTFTPGIALNNTIIDQWSDVTRQEIAVEAAKHGESCVNVAFPFGDHEKCDHSHLAKRAPLYTKMKKGIKLPKKVLSPKLVNYIDCMTGIEVQADPDSLKSTVVEEIVPAQCGINGLGTEEMHMADTLDNRLDQIFEEGVDETSTSSTMEFPELMETLESMSPNSKSIAHTYTPRKRKAFLEGYAMGVSRSLSSHEEADQEIERSQGTQEPHTDEEKDVPTNADTPSVSGAFGVFKTARKALKLQDVSDTDDQDEDADTCTMCQKAYPPSGKSKNITWIECSQCNHWYHLQCAGLNKAPQKKKKWFCASCRKNQKE